MKKIKFSGNFFLSPPMTSVDGTIIYGIMNTANARLRLGPVRVCATVRMENEENHTQTTSHTYVGKLSTGFEYFASGFAERLVMAALRVQLGAESNFASNGGFKVTQSSSSCDRKDRNTAFLSTVD